MAAALAGVTGSGSGSQAGGAAGLSAVRLAAARATGAAAELADAFGEPVLAAALRSTLALRLSSEEDESHEDLAQALGEVDRALRQHAALRRGAAAPAADQQQGRQEDAAVGSPAALTAPQRCGARQPTAEANDEVPPPDTARAAPKQPSHFEPAQSHLLRGAEAQTCTDAQLGVAAAAAASTAAAYSAGTAPARPVLRVSPTPPTTLASPPLSPQSPWRPLSARERDRQALLDMGRGEGASPTRSPREAQPSPRRRPMSPRPSSPRPFGTVGPTATGIAAQPKHPASMLIATGFRGQSRSTASSSASARPSSARLSSQRRLLASRGGGTADDASGVKAIRAILTRYNYSNSGLQEGSVARSARTGMTGLAESTAPGEDGEKTQHVGSVVYRTNGATIMSCSSIRREQRPAPAARPWSAAARHGTRGTQAGRSGGGGAARVGSRPASAGVASTKAGGSRPQSAQRVRFAPPEQLEKGRASPVAVRNADVPIRHTSSPGGLGGWEGEGASDLHSIELARPL